MTVITRWEPFRELNTLQDRLTRLFQQSVGDGRDEASDHQQLRAGS